MRLILGITSLATAFALAVTSPALAITVTGDAALDGLQVVPPTAATATGAMTLELDTTTGLIDISGSVLGLSIADITFPSGGLAFGAAGPFHIHQGPAGTNGGIVVFINQLSYFTDTAGGFDVVATGLSFDLAFVSDLLAGDMYFQLHTPGDPGGHIRGQISAIPEPGTALLMAMGLTFLSMRSTRVRSGA